MTKEEPIILLEENLINLILKEETKKKDVIEPYLNFMVRAFRRPPHHSLAKVNEAIIKRWSKSALIEIKNKAGKRLGTLPPYKSNGVSFTGKVFIFDNPKGLRDER